MTPLELIKQGIINADIDTINQGYEALTGKSALENVLDLPTEEKITAQPYVTEEVDESNTDPDDPFRVQIRSGNKQQTRTLEDGTTQTEARREKVDLKKIGSFNMFQDDGKTGAEYKKEDKKLDKQAALKTKVDRRKQTEKIAATCVDCGKNYMVLPIHQLAGSFTCSKCMKRKQRR